MTHWKRYTAVLAALGVISAAGCSHQQGAANPVPGSSGAPPTAAQQAAQQAARNQADQAISAQRAAGQQAGAQAAAQAAARAQQGPPR